LEHKESLIANVPSKVENVSVEALKSKISELVDEDNLMYDSRNSIKDYKLSFVQYYCLYVFWYRGKLSRGGNDNTFYNDFKKSEQKEVSSDPVHRELLSMFYQFVQNIINGKFIENY
jgi:hypothetical protein